MTSSLKSTRERFGSPDPRAVEALKEKARAVPPTHEPGGRDTGIKEFFLYLLLAATPEQFAEAVDEHRCMLEGLCFGDEELRQVVLTGLELGIQQDCAQSANELGALYYTGDIVEQDYENARDLYELAMSLGSTQATINLGYIYEYGRTGAPDLDQAFRCYSLAATLYNAPEALYKMGDLLGRKRDSASASSPRLSFELWSKSYEVAAEVGDLENQGQAAFRLAPFFLDVRKAAEVGVEFSPLQALQLYQTAELGLRLAIDHGLTYYAKRLGQAMEGQQQARDALESFCID